jgi:hypothetical protein
VFFNLANEWGGLPKKFFKKIFLNLFFSKKNLYIDPSRRHIIPFIPADIRLIRFIDQPITYSSLSRNSSQKS